MRKIALYSGSRRTPGPARRDPEHGPDGARSSEAAATSGKRPAGSLRSYRQYRSPLLVAAGAAIALGAVMLHAALNPAPAPVTQEDVDAAVVRTLKEAALPSQATRAAHIIGPSVVLVRRMGGEAQEADEGVGSGVVIVDSGIILTNLHVVSGAKRIGVVFADGHESSATVIAEQPENDLAVLQAASLPDDLIPATLASHRDLEIGDQVVAVGFPFGIGPSVSAGVVSGLGRQHHTPDGTRALTDLIQFDAAVNPGSSGGPLVTTQGEVVGIVTGILNPNAQRVFIGIGFAVPIQSAAAAAGLSPF
jgi:S1-C subfamily serine protease